MVFSHLPHSSLNRSRSGEGLLDYNMEKRHILEAARAKMRFGDHYASTADSMMDCH
jgi:hypothetical protein